MFQLIFRLANYFLFAGTIAFFGIGEGPSSSENQQYGNLAAGANFATNEGESAISSSNNFWQAILSGDPTQVSKVLGPEFSAINKQAQQKKKTNAEFGNRSGGTNAENQSIDDTARSTVDSSISSLTGSAASALGASGSSLLAAGMSGHEAAFSAANTIQQQRSAQLNDIFKSITSIASAFLPGGKGTGAFKSLFGGGGNSSAEALDQQSVDDTFNSFDTSNLN
jgi:hypothetical protein